MLETTVSPSSLQNWKFSKSCSSIREPAAVWYLNELFGLDVSPYDWFEEEGEQLEEQEKICAGLHVDVAVI